MRFGSPLIVALTLAAGSASPAAAQSITPTDVQRLQDSIYDASRAVGQLRSRDANEASQLQAELDDASDEAIYLKVKLRKNEPIARYEYADVRDRVLSANVYISSFPGAEALRPPARFIPSWAIDRLSSRAEIS